MSPVAPSVYYHQVVTVRKRAFKFVCTIIDLGIQHLACLSSQVLIPAPPTNGILLKLRLSQAFNLHWGCVVALDVVRQRVRLCRKVPCRAFEPILLSVYAF